MRQSFVAAAIILLFAVSGWIWYRYIRAPGEAPPPARLESELLKQYRQLKNLEPDISIFSDPVYRSLERFRPATTSPALPRGRPNPFIPF